MSVKKLIFTSISLPLAYKTHWAYNWQKDRKKEKIKDVEIRKNKLRQLPIEFKLYDLQGMDLDSEEFLNDWVYRPVRISGVMDHAKEVFI